MEDLKSLFSSLLDLEEPWQVAEVSFDKEKQQLDIHLNFARGYKFKAPDGKLYTAYDRVKRSWQHNLNVFEYSCVLYARVPRVRQQDGKIRIQKVPWKKLL